MANATQWRGTKSKFAGAPKGLRHWLQRVMTDHRAARAMELALIEIAKREAAKRTAP